MLNSGLGTSFIIPVFLICFCYGSPLNLSTFYQVPPSHLSHKAGQTDHDLASKTTGHHTPGTASGACGLTSECEDRINCGNGGTCYINQTSCVVMCLCTINFTGDACQYPTRDFSLQREQFNEALLDDFIPDYQDTIMSRSNNSEINDTIPEEAVCRQPNRTSNGCPLRFPCRHGVCPSEDGNDTQKGASGIPRLTCVCDPGWSGHQCDECCPLNCGNGTCVQEDGGAKCVCHWGYKGPRCETFDPELKRLLEKEHRPSSLTTLAVVISLVTAAVLGGAAIVTIFLVWKHRMPLILKIIDRLHRRCEKYDNTEYIYDAFISYSSSVRSDYNPTGQLTMDDQFVIHTLFPTLEKMGYRVCLHYRDFIPGRAIIDNIIDAVQHSKRTLLVISPDFANSEWTRFEYQIAQHEMLKLRHRMVPILYRDVSQIPDLDPNLRYILSSVTYVKWPCTEDQSDLDSFWRSLKNSLPDSPLGNSNSCDILSNNGLNNNPKQSQTNKALQVDHELNVDSDNRAQCQDRYVKTLL